MAVKLEEVVRDRCKSRLAMADKNLQEIFSNLNLAFLEDVDPVKSFECLKHARSLALELRN